MSHPEHVVTGNEQLSAKNGQKRPGNVEVRTVLTQEILLQLLREARDGRRVVRTEGDPRGGKPKQTEFVEGGAVRILDRIPKSHHEIKPSMARAIQDLYDQVHKLILHETPPGSVTKEQRDDLCVQVKKAVDRARQSVRNTYFDQAVKPELQRAEALVQSMQCAEVDQAESQPPASKIDQHDNLSLPAKQVTEAETRDDREFLTRERLGELLYEVLNTWKQGMVGTAALRTLVPSSVGGAQDPHAFLLRWIVIHVNGIVDSVASMIRGKSDLAALKNHIMGRMQKLSQQAQEEMAEAARQHKLCTKPHAGVVVSINAHVIGGIMKKIEGFERREDFYAAGAGLPLGHGSHLNADVLLDSWFLAGGQPKGGVDSFTDEPGAAAGVDDGPDDSTTSNGAGKEDAQPLVAEVAVILEYLRKQGVETVADLNKDYRKRLRNSLRNRLGREYSKEDVKGRLAQAVAAHLSGENPLPVDEYLQRVRHANAPDDGEEITHDVLWHRKYWAQATAELRAQGKELFAKRQSREMRAATFEDKLAELVQHVLREVYEGKKEMEGHVHGYLMTCVELFAVEEEVRARFAVGQRISRSLVRPVYDAIAAIVYSNRFPLSQELREVLGIYLDAVGVLIPEGQERDFETPGKVFIDGRMESRGYPIPAAWSRALPELEESRIRQLSTFTAEQGAFLTEKLRPLLKHIDRDKLPATDQQEVAAAFEAQFGFPIAGKLWFAFNQLLQQVLFASTLEKPRDPVQDVPEVLPKRDDSASNVLTEAEQDFIRKRLRWIRQQKLPDITTVELKKQIDVTRIRRKQPLIEIEVVQQTRETILAEFIEEQQRRAAAQLQQADALPNVPPAITEALASVGSSPGKSLERDDSSAGRKVPGVNEADLANVSAQDGASSLVVGGSDPEQVDNHVWNICTTECRLLTRRYESVQGEDNPVAYLTGMLRDWHEKNATGIFQDEHTRVAVEWFCHHKRTHGEFPFPQNYYEQRKRALLSLALASFSQESASTGFVTTEEAKGEVRLDATGTPETTALSEFRGEHSHDGASADGSAAEVSDTGIAASESAAGEEAAQQTTMSLSENTNTASNILSKGEADREVDEEKCSVEDRARIRDAIQRLGITKMDAQGKSAIYAALRGVISPKEGRTGVQLLHVIIEEFHNVRGTKPKEVQKKKLSQGLGGQSGVSTQVHVAENQPSAKLHGPHHAQDEAPPLKNWQLRPEEVQIVRNFVDEEVKRDPQVLDAHFETKAGERKVYDFSMPIMNRFNREVRGSKNTVPPAEFKLHVRQRLKELQQERQAGEKTSTAKVRKSAKPATAPSPVVVRTTEENDDRNVDQSEKEAKGDIPVGSVPLRSALEQHLLGIFEAQYLRSLPGYAAGSGKMPALPTEASIGKVVAQLQAVCAPAAAIVEQQQQTAEFLEKNSIDAERACLNSGKFTDITTEAESALKVLRTFSGQLQLHDRQCEQLNALEEQAMQARKMLADFRMTCQVLDRFARSEIFSAIEFMDTTQYGIASIAQLRIELTVRELIDDTIPHCEDMVRGTFGSKYEFRDSDKRRDLHVSQQAAIDTLTALAAAKIEQLRRLTGNG